MSAVNGNIDQMLSCCDDEVRGIVSGLISQIKSIVDSNGIYGEMAVCAVSSALIEDVAKAQSSRRK